MPFRRHSHPCPFVRVSAVCSIKAPRPTATRDRLGCIRLAQHVCVYKHWRLAIAVAGSSCGQESHQVPRARPCGKTVLYLAFHCLRKLASFVLANYAS